MQSLSFFILLSITLRTIELVLIWNLWRPKHVFRDIKNWRMWPKKIRILISFNQNFGTVKQNFLAVYTTFFLVFILVHVNNNYSHKNVLLYYILYQNFWPLVPTFWFVVNVRQGFIKHWKTCLIKPCRMGNSTFDAIKQYKKYRKFFFFFGFILRINKKQNPCRL